MNKIRPVKEIMVANPITVSPNDQLKVIYEIFQTKNIHHLPVVEGQKLVGMISKSDLLFFLDGKIYEDQSLYARSVEKIRLNRFTAKDIMTKKLATMESIEPIRTAINLFTINKFHALPIMNNEKLVGIVTTLDLIAALDKEPIALADYN